MKRAIDVVGSLVLLMGALAVLVPAAIAVAVSSPGPILHRQQRIGRDGRPFTIRKLRSMYVDAEQRRQEFEDRNECTGPVFKIRRDPRVTRVGRVLRKLSIDELPQLWNVLKGEMSLVGPRPPLPLEYAAFGPRERNRLRAKPGLTCIWQVSGRSDVDFEQWVEMDLQYIREWSLRLDLRLLARTIPAVLSGRGAY